MPEGEQPEWLGASLYEELKNPKSLQGTFKTYLRLVDDLGYADVLSKTGSKTLFAANDEAFERFFANGNNRFGKSSYEELTTSEKSQLLFASMIDNAIVSGGLSTDATGTQGKVVKHPSNLRTVQAVLPLFSQNMPQNNKWFSYWKDRGLSINAVYDDTQIGIVHFNGEYFLNNTMTINGKESDYFVITGNEYEQGDVFVYGEKVVDNMSTGDKGNVTCQNGYIHQVSGVVTNPGNMAQLLRTNGGTNYFSRMVDYFATAQPMDAEFQNSYREYAKDFGTQDSVYAIRYLARKTRESVASAGSSGFLTPKPNGKAVDKSEALLFDPGWNDYKTSSGSSADVAAILAPTDKALETYFSEKAGYIIKNLGVPGLPYDKENIHNTLGAHLDAMYNVKPAVVASLVNNVLETSLANCVPSKFYTVQNDAHEFINPEKSDIEMKDTTYDVLVANNGVIYKMKKYFAPDIYSSVLGPASVYVDMNTMGTMLQDKQDAPGADSPLGVNMYFYLLSMKSRYALFVPTDGSRFLYIDPASIFDNDGAKILEFKYDPTINDPNSTLNIYVNRYKYDMATGIIGEKDPNVNNIPVGSLQTAIKGVFNSQISDMLNYHTVVLDGTSSLTGNKFYLTKHGGAIMVPDGKGENINTSTVLGGAQIGNTGSLPASIITELFNSGTEAAKITNGSVYRIDAPIQPTIKTVYNILDENPAFHDFRDFCLYFSDPENVRPILYWIGKIKTNDDAAVQASKLKSFEIFGENNALNMLGAYNYTMYVPTNMEEAYSNGLPRWSEIIDRYNNWQNYYSSEGAAKEGVKSLLDKMHNFVLIHMQNNSVFDDVNTNTNANESFFTNQLGIATKLSLVKDGTGLYVNDNVPASKRAELPKVISSNNLARDIRIAEKDKPITYNNSTFKYNTIESSAFVVVHGIDKPLCYSADYQY